MGLSTALYSATSGLSVHSEKMTTIGNNLSNVSTTGFKKARMHFEDAMYQNISTASGNDQLGRGVTVSAVMSDFSQGSMESTNQPTDLAIGGEGFFITSPKGQEMQYYTRAGNFRFDKDGYLTDPHDNVVQGWQLAEEDTSVAASETATNQQGVKTEGVPTDVRLEDFQSSPQATGRVNQIVNLDSRSEDRNTNSSNPYFAMFNDWDGTSDDPIADNRYAYQSTIKVYDSNGSSHNLTTYFDPVKEDLENEGGKQHWEYLTTVSPSADNRTFWQDAPSQRKRGILMSGTLRFSSTGQLESRSAFTLRDVNQDPSIEGTQFLNAQEFDFSGVDDVDLSAGDTYGFLLDHDGELSSDFEEITGGTGSGTVTELIDNLANNINNNPDLASEGVTARREGAQLIISGGINVVSDVTTSPSATALSDLSSLANSDFGPGYVTDDAPNQSENWLPAQFSAEGNPIATPNFRGVANADTTNQVSQNDEGNNIAINFGATNRDLSYDIDWNNNGDAESDPGDYPFLGGWEHLNEIDIDGDPGDGSGDDGPDQSANSIEDWGANNPPDFDTVNLDDPPFPMPNYKDFNTQARSATNFSSGSTTNTQSQDGYAPGFLQNISVDRDGVMTGTYSNGQVKNLYVLTLAQFNSDQGLRKEGGNMFTETRESGPPLTGKPGTGGLGTIASNSLEQSNVDMSEEFVKMITTQKGFQANARTITTTDSMLQEVVNLKR